MKNERKTEVVHLEPRGEVQRTYSPTDMLMTTACLDVYKSLTLPQKVAARTRQFFSPRDRLVDKF